ncbi:hypothetical protein BIW11_12643 [Tropilaelaps mercedesae]|uniref:Uncharacterized protein n=1 Tax=Tropilaelaps mercedesae TaxID=418985 RepID=A0A1V9X624_9ACAR|nr:hypothetical protein BIW11_12643 [Tropilaelaps mercedesae]
MIFDDHFRRQSAKVEPSGHKSLLRLFCDEIKAFEADPDSSRYSVELRPIAQILRLLADDDTCRNTMANTGIISSIVSCLDFSKSSNAAWRNTWRRRLLEHATCDRFVAITRWKIRERMNRTITSTLLPTSMPADQQHVVRVDLTDAEEVNGGNPKQEMSACIVVSPAAVLLVMQLVGKQRL